MIQQSRPAAMPAAGLTDLHAPAARDGARPARPTITSSTGAVASRASVGAAASRSWRPLPAEPVGNADAELWALLGPEERAFFADAAPGALTYGPGRLTTPVGVRGRFIDLRA